MERLSLKLKQTVSLICQQGERQPRRRCLPRRQTGLDFSSGEVPQDCNARNVPHRSITLPCRNLHMHISNSVFYFIYPTDTWKAIATQIFVVTPLPV